MVGMPEVLAHLNAALNAAICVLLVWGRLAIWRGDRVLHPRLMLAAVGVGSVFVAGYVAQVVLAGHQRFPGNDWVRTLFLTILVSHIALAVTVVPQVTRVLFLASRQRHAEHRRIARIAFPVWLYVALTGVVIYWMNQQLRPPL
jgi:putative membrane protein